MPKSPPKLSSLEQQPLPAANAAWTEPGGVLGLISVSWLIRMCPQDESVVRQLSSSAVLLTAEDAESTAGFFGFLF